MKFLSEGELKSCCFMVTVSVKSRGKRKYTDPTFIKLKDLTIEETNLLSNLLLKYGRKTKTKPQASKARSDTSIKKIQRKGSVHKQKQRK